MRLRPQTDFEAVIKLLTAGMTDSDVARATGVPRSTVTAWRTGRAGQYHRRLLQASAEWRPRDPHAYAYLLGIYLGDGWVVATTAGAASLCVSMDSAYAGVIAEVENAIARVFVERPVRTVLRANGNNAILRVSDPAVPFAFPQHGPGRKHERTIALTPWQADITSADPRALLRGLMHSDGCRTINRFSTTLPSGRVAEYEYPRYFFSNLSADIRDVFCAHCDLLGIRWTQSNPRNISISQRDSVALMEQFVGPKR